LIEQLFPLWPVQLNIYIL